MHDTAYRIGGLVMNTYLPVSPAKILEIGALDVNGTLRDHSPRNAEYVGLDFEAGSGVDTVITSLEDWNVPDAHFDLVVASSVFEHDPAFWKTFVEMCRKTKPGGHIYVSAPSNGTIHRYPQDCWRFYPDAGFALEQWGRVEGFDITLIESFIAEREADGWNDFCAVFRIGPCKSDLNLDFVHTKVRATNAANWRSSLIIDPDEDPEDVRLLRRSREEGHVLRLEGEALREELQLLRIAHDDAHTRLSESDAQLRNSRSEVETLRDELQLLHSTHEEMQARFAANDAQLRATHSAEIAARESQAAELNRQLVELANQKAGIEQRLHERFREIAGLTRLIQERDQVIEREHARAEWLRQVVSVLTRGFSTSRKARLGSMMPTWFSQRRQRMLLRKRGLFDPNDYTAAYPDVTNSGTDPLRHYINHGIMEGRSSGRRSQGH